MPDTAEAVAQYGSAVYRLAYAMTRSRSDADDVFQEVFLRLHRSAPDFANEEHRRAWLLRVTANCARSLLASPWRMRTLPLEDVYSYQDSVESAVDEALAHLPGKYRPSSTCSTMRAIRRRRSPGFWAGLPPPSGHS